MKFNLDFKLPIAQTFLELLKRQLIVGLKYISCNKSALRTTALACVLWMIDRAKWSTFFLLEYKISTKVHMYLPL